MNCTLGITAASAADWGNAFCLQCLGRMKLSESCADPRCLVSRAPVLLIEMIAGHRQQANNVWQGSMYKCIGVETGTSHVYATHYSLQQPWINICRISNFQNRILKALFPLPPWYVRFLVVFRNVYARWSFQKYLAKIQFGMIHLFIHGSRVEVVWG